MVDGWHIPIWSSTKKPFAIVLSGTGGGEGRETMGTMKLTHSISLIRIVTMNSSCIMNIS
jgi:hypothetical protein